jgi:hypothetical protein
VSLVVFFFLIGTGSVCTATAKSEPDEIQLTFDAQLETVEVEHCFSATGRPNSLTATSDLSNSISRITTSTRFDAPLDLRIEDNLVTLPKGSFGCLHYMINLPKGRDGDWRSGLNRHNGGLVLELDRLLLRRTPTGRLRGAKLFINTGNNVNASAPGAMIEKGQDRVGFKLLERPNDWGGSVAVGELQISNIVSSEMTVELVVVGTIAAPIATKLENWVRTGIETLTHLYGRLPVPQLQILVFPLGYNSDPVPWGEVTRGGGDAVHLYVDSTRPLDELNSNWVLTHELSHLTHPYLTGSDSWLGEGIASYYQNVLRARSGLLERESAWKKLDTGFKRGIAQLNRFDTLADHTQAMLRNRQYMRVYWSGAAIALISDVQYLEQSAGGVTLDALLDEFSRCCLPSRRRWRALELMTKLDELAGFDVMVPLHEKFVMKPTFPDLEESYKILGLRRGSNELLFDNNPEVTNRRGRIMAK